MQQFNLGEATAARVLLIGSTPPSISCAEISPIQLKSELIRRRLRHLEDQPSLAVRRHFVLRNVYTAFLDGGGNLGELSDLATVILAEAERSRHDLPEAWCDDALPACISFDEGNKISAFAVCVVGRSNAADARKWMSSVFIPGVLPIVLDQLSRENEAAHDGSPTNKALH